MRQDMQESSWRRRRGYGRCQDDVLTLKNPIWLAPLETEHPRAECSQFPLKSPQRLGMVRHYPNFFLEIPHAGGN